MAPQSGLVELPLANAARGRPLRSAAWCAMAVVVAMALDAMRVPLGGIRLGAQLNWLDLAAGACLAAALFVPGTLRSRASWTTPLDGRVIAGVLVSILQVLPGSGEVNGHVWLRQTIECTALFYGLTVLVRAQPGAAESLWDVAAAACVLLSVHALLGATNGVVSLRAASEAADGGWAAQSGLFKTTLFVTILCAGRALDRGAGNGWRVIALLGAAGTIIHGATSGTGLHASMLARLDAPVHFSNVVVMLLLLSGLLKQAWELRRKRREEASRWRGAALAIVALGIMGVFGGATGGSGLRALAAVVAVLLVTRGEQAVKGETLPLPEYADQQRAA